MGLPKSGQQRPVKANIGPSKPRYVQLADEIRTAIYSGALTAGAHFPTESALCKAHGVSRFTVREALRRLEIEGLISRRRGSGTMIKAASARGGTLHQPLSNVGEILQYARDTRNRYAPFGLTKVPRRVIDRIEGKVDGEWLHYRGLRTREGEEKPIATVDAYIYPSVPSLAEQLDLEGATLFRQVEQITGVAVGRVTQDIQAVPASGEVALDLGIPRRSACLRVLRCYYDANDRLFEISVSHHPGDRFAYSMHIDVDS